MWYSYAKQKFYGFKTLDKLEGYPKKTKISKCRTVFRFLGINFNFKAGKCSFGRGKGGGRGDSRSAQAVFPPGTSTPFQLLAIQ